MSELKIGSKVNVVSVSLNQNMSIKEAKIERFAVLGISEHYYCLDDPYFTTIARTKTFEFSHPKLNKVSVGEEKSKTMIDIFGKFRIRTLSTSSLKVIENRINKEFNNWLDEKIGIYGCARRTHIKLEK